MWRVQSDAVEEGWVRCKGWGRYVGKRLMTGRGGVEKVVSLNFGEGEEEEGMGRVTRTYEEGNSAMLFVRWVG